MQNTKPAQSRKRYYHTIALWISLIITGIHIIQHIYPSVTTDYSLHYGSTIITAFTFQLLHSNPFHLMANIWTFLLLCFNLHITPIQIIQSYIISAVFGISLLLLHMEFTPIIGFSAPIYALLGSRGIIGSPKQIMRFNAVILSTIIITGLIPRVSITAHLACYLLSIIVSILTTPIIIRKK